MPNPPRIVVLVPRRYAKPNLGRKLFHTPRCSVFRPLACVIAYHIAPGALVAGLITFGSNDLSLPFTSDQPVFPSHRSPRFRVSFGLTLKSSWMKTPGFLSLPPYSGETEADHDFA